MTATAAQTPFFGYHMPSFSYPGVDDAGRFDNLVSLVQAAETAGFDMVTTMDHVYQIAPVGSEDEPMLEAYTTIGALAARTSRVKLGAMVAGVTYRNPAILAKQVTTLDLISGGRAVLGLGAAWNESEHRGYGFEFPSLGERMDRLDEALQICKLMFTEERRAPASRAATTGSSAPSTTRGLSSREARRSWSAAAASGGRCAWWPATRTCRTGSARSTS
jgi:alkanesulfonate monooxygenase SsuD/methylene tetrahydromethanopterin reductase-like flavin-dependent oxidoreductase (luciferase family)